MGGDETDKFLRSLAVSMEAVSQQAGPISTHSFTVLCDRMMPVFSHLGSVFHFAKTEMDSKTSSLKAVEGRCPDLPQVVAADQAAGTLTKKGSPARNLHRLMNTIMFIKVLFEKLLEGSGVSLKDAASAAYEAALAPIHNFMVKTAIRTGMPVTDGAASACSSGLACLPPSCSPSI